MGLQVSLDPELAKALQVAREAQLAVQSILLDLAQRAAASTTLLGVATAVTPTGIPVGLPASVEAPRKPVHERTAVMNASAIAEMIAHARNAVIAQTTASPAESPVHRAHRVLAGSWMAYQPVVAAHGLHPVAYESLARTVASGIGGTLPAIAALDAAGMLPAFSRSVRTQVAAALAAHNAVQTMFVNIEESDLEDALLGSSADPLTAHANRVVFDLSLSRFKCRIAVYRRRIERLQARGFRFALDDFGVATVGLQALDELRPQFVKLGIHTTERLDTDPRKQAVLTTIVRACASRGTIVVAKAIERKSEFEAAAAIGVPWMSGWYCGQAGPAPR